MVILKIQLRDGLPFHAEGQPPIACHGDAVDTFSLARERYTLPLPTLLGPKQHPLAVGILIVEHQPGAVIVDIIEG